MRLRSSFLLLAGAALLTAAPPASGSGDAQSAAVRARLTCVTSGGDTTEFRRKPRSCTIFGPGGTFGGGVDLKRIAWRGWGRREATARALECGFRAECTGPRVGVRAYRLRRGCRGVRVYTRLRATSRFGSTTVRVATCPSRA